MILSKSINKQVNKCVFVMAAILLLSCNTTRIIKPLAKGEKVIGAGFGGALITFAGAPIPIPLTNIYGAYGIKNNTTGFASLHTTALLFGVFQTDIGITQNVIKQHHYWPAISVSPIVNLMFDKWEKKLGFYPQLDVNAYWNYGAKQKLIFATINNWFELQSQKAHEQTQPTHWLPSIGVGHQWQGKKINWQVEVKYLAPNQSNKNIVVDYIGFGNSGTLGLYMSVNRKF